MDGPDAYARSPQGRTESFDRRAGSRDREPYRENRRGQDRRRNNGNRNRSRSPTQIDRYQPDRQRDDYYGSGRDREGPRRRRPSSPPPLDRYIPGDDSASRSIPVNRIRDPLLEASQVGFSYFSEWWRTEQDIKAARERQRTGRRQEAPKDTPEEQRAKIQSAYDDYKLAWNARMAKYFVLTHKNDNWFRERYDPSIRDPLRARISAYRKGLYESWERDMDAGTFDDFTMEGIYKSESNGAGGIVEKEEGEASAAAEVLNVSDLLPAKGGEIKDPVASLPTLLIKTITPAVPRSNIEEFCKEHLGDGPGGLKWLSLSDPNPSKKFHRLAWLMLNPDEDNGNTDTVVRRRSVDANGEGQEDIAMDEDQNTSQTLQERSLAQINDKTIQDPEKGDFTVHVGVHRPAEVVRKKALWDLFSVPERIEKDLSLAVRLVTKLDEEMGLPGALVKVEQRVEDLTGKGYLQPPVVPAKRSRSDDADGDDDMEEGEEGEEREEEDVDDEDMLIKKKKLDLLVEYLRRVHNFCFFCVFETDSVHELSRKCMGGHLRRPRASLTTSAKEVARASAAGEDFPADKGEENGDGALSPAPGTTRRVGRQYGKSQLQKAYNWVKTFEEKLYQVLEPENADLKKLGGCPLDEALDEELGKFVKQEDAAKFRCKVPECTKLFKGVDFWRKHVEKRHEEWFQKMKEELELINRYVLDPSRLAQGRNDAASNGHFPIKDQQPLGTPRNFSLNNPMIGPHFVPGMPPAMFNPMMGSYPMTVAGAWPIPGQDASLGPMRNGMRMGNGRGPGPYDRPGGRRNTGGRLSPPRGAMSRGRPSYTEGGIGTFGGAQAVEGRTMKSYNDLDAAGTSQQGGGELDY